MTRRSSKRAAELEEDRKSIKSCKIAIQALLADVAQHRDSWPFMDPVTKEEVPDYHEYISHPMDFGTVKAKFDSDSYETVQQFVQDCTQIFKNCEIYNRENSSVYKYVEPNYFGFGGQRLHSHEALNVLCCNTPGQCVFFFV